MDESTQNIIAQQMQIIPKELKDAILASDYAEKLQTITKNNHLMIDQAGKLETETSLVLLGLAPLDEYLSNLQNNVGLDKIKAPVVAHDVNELIFKNVRETLQKLSSLAKEAADAAPADTVPVTVTTTVPLVSSTPVQTVPVIPTTQVEIRPDMIPEIVPKLPEKPKEYSLKPNIAAPYHQNIAPVTDVIVAKTSGPVIVPQEKIVVEEKTKLPEKSKPTSGVDPYREPVI